MRFISYPEPPNPEDSMFREPKDFNLAMYRWACGMKSQLQLQSRINDRPTAQNFVLGTYTTSSTLAGTNTGTAVTNVLCTLIQALLNKGILKTHIINQ